MKTCYLVNVMPIVLWIQTEIESSVIQHRLQHRERIFFFQYGECQSLSHVCLCDLMDCSPLGSSVHGITQAKILEWVAYFLLQGIFLTQGSNLGLSHCRQILYCLSHQGSPCVCVCVCVHACVRACVCVCLN